MNKFDVTGIGMLSTSEAALCSKRNETFQARR